MKQKPDFPDVFNICLQYMFEKTFIFRLTEYQCNNTYDIYFLIYHEYF